MFPFGFNPYGNRPNYGVFNGMTQGQFDHLTRTQVNNGFIPNTVRINNYDNPVMNVADRNWQEVLRRDPTYVWTQADRDSYRRNCDFGPHNGGPAIDKILFPPK
jgi:hypothetical protein